MADERPEQPELYQLVGAALRDVAQARFMSDIFSRQIAFVYEGDGVLRRFPVPRVDIDEAEITLHFVVKEVAVDPHRRSSRNAAIGALFDRYSARIIREAMQRVRDEARNVAVAADDETKNALAAFEKRFLSDEHRELLTGRLLQYLNEAVGRLVSDDCTLDVDAVMKDLDDDVATSVLHQAEAEVLKAHFEPQEWSGLLESVRVRYKTQVERLADDIGALRDRYPDYRITIDPSAAAAADGATLSTIRIKSSVRNYKWSKVDVDETDLRNIRTLNPE